MKHLCLPSRLALLLCVLALLLLTLPSRSPNMVSAATGTVPSPEDEVQAAWRRAQESGVYHFATGIVQTTYLAPRLANVGRSSRVESLYLEGETNLPERVMRMTLWQNGGSVLAPRDGVEVRIEGERAYGRQTGGSWQEMDDFSGAFAPDSDLLAYLAGARNVREIGTETREFGTRHSESGSLSPLALPGMQTVELPPTDIQYPLSTVHFTRYAFDVDGAAFGVYLRDRLEHHLMETGELPAGLTLDVSNEYRSVIGDGEAWIDDDGLPLRLSVHLEYPQQSNGERVQADIQTDFSNFDREQIASASSHPLSYIQSRLPRAATEWQKLGLQLGLILGSTGFALLMVSHRHSKKLYAALALAMVLSMIVTPLLQSHHVHAFNIQQATRRAEQEREQEEYAAVREWQESLLTSNWNPHQDPLAGELAESPHPLAESLAGFFSSSSADTPDADSDADGDGLTYAQETQLGADPDNADTDGDQLRDDLEVKGFILSGKRWYSDPLSPDTNMDGILDGLECWGTIPSSLPSNQTCDRDIDYDGVPDLFDRDNDNDGVSDRVDGSPEKALDGFSKDNPFKLIVDNLRTNYPTFVDIQLRPKNPEHLTYALNVLDWPSGDTEGQIQRSKDNTFADTMSSAQVAADPSSRNGDMRLIPMLEIKMSGNTLPLPLTTPVHSLQVQGVESDTRWISATINLTQSGNNTSLDFQSSGATSGVTLEIYGSSCPAANATKEYTLTDLSNGDTRTLGGRNLLKLADGGHSVVLRQGEKAICANLGDVPNGPYSSKMIDMSKLQTHGISIRDTDDTGGMTAYVPLNVVADETGGGRAAFSARMVYWPNSSAWGKAHEMRVIWLVQLLGDDGKTQVIHTYPEEWTMTGLNVREDHGLDIAIAFENPDYDTNLEADDRLWHTARGLQAAFITGRDQDGNGQRDVTIATFKSRFDNTSNDSTSTANRWGIPGGAVKVWTKSYPHQDYLAEIPMQHAADILNTYFTSGGSPRTDAPLLLFAREEHYRSASLDMKDGIISISGQRVTVNMSASKVSQDTLASINWAPYRHRNGKWEAYPLQEYVDKMTIRHKNMFEANIDPLAMEGLALVTRSFSIAMVQGMSSVVQSGQMVIKAKAQEDESDKSLAEQYVEGTGEVLTFVADELAEDFLEGFNGKWLRTSEGRRYFKGISYLKGFSSKERLKIIGSVAKGTLMDKFSIPKPSLKSLGAMAMGGVAVGAVALSIAASATGDTAVTHVANGLSLITAIQGVREAYEAFSEARKLTQGVTGIANKMKAAGSNLKGAAYKAGIIGLVIAIGVTIGVFMAQVIGQVRFGSLAFNAALAGAIAGVITAVIMFAIMLIPVVGQIIAAVIALIDALIMGICAIVDAATDKDESGKKWSERGAGGWFCKGISGLVAEGIKWTIYSQTALVGNLDDSERSKIKNFQPALVNTEQGFSAGNKVKYSLQVENAITLADVPIEWKAALYFWQYSYANLDSATFKYVLQPGTIEGGEQRKPENGVPGVERNQMEDDWDRESDAFKGEDALVNIQDVSGVSALGQAGINVPTSLYLTESYAVPVQECWVIPPNPLIWFPIPVCYIRTDKKDNHTNLGKNVQWDIFPATLDQFYACESDSPDHKCHKNGGYSLAWGQSGNITFPRMKDFDGDGLLLKGSSGSDPNDSRWDTDNDGLSDYYELGKGTDPEAVDSDNDELTDSEEILLGTDPNRQDTDGDGLTDKEEVDGWEFVYALTDSGTQLKTWVTSDPVNADSDSDTLLDSQEKTYGFHPGVKTDPDLLNYDSTVREVDASVMLLRFEETDGATLFSDTSGDLNNALCEEGPCPTAGHYGKYGNGLVFDGYSDYIKVGNEIKLDIETFTIAFWAKPDTTGRDMTIIGQGTDGNTKGLNIGFRANNRFTCSFYGSNYEVDTSAYGDTDWHHWACSYDVDSRQIKIYRDGVKVAQNGTWWHYTGSGDLEIGRAPWGNYFSGSVDEVSLFRSELSQEQIQAVMEGRYNLNDRIVKPGDSLSYTGTAENRLLNRYTNGLLTTELPDGYGNNVPPTSFILQPHQKQEMTGQITVDPDAISGKVNLTQVASGIVVDRREESGYADLWLPFNEGSGASTFNDFSGNMPAQNGRCSWNKCPDAGKDGVVGQAVQFDSGDYVYVPHNTLFDFGANRDFTVMLWVKSSSWSGDPAIVSNKNWNWGNNKGFVLAAMSDGRWKMNIGDGSDRVDLTGGVINDDNWHHLAATFDRDGEVIIYQDGAQVASSSMSAIGDIDTNYSIAIAQDGTLNYSYGFTGFIDEVRIFPQVLPFDEVVRIAGIPVVDMNLDEWSSSYTCGPGTHVSCSGSHCPNRTTGVGGGGAQEFDGDDYIPLLYKAPVLDNGKFTISAWIMPKDFKGWHGVWGYNFGEKSSYPSLAVSWENVRFGFGTGDNWLERTSTYPFDFGSWYHLVVTFDGNTYRLFINGEKTDEYIFGGQPSRYNALDLGRASNRATVYVDRIYINNENDGAGSAEIYINFDGDRIWYQGDLDDGDTVQIDKELTFTETAKLEIWEDDSGDDDHIGTIEFSTSESGQRYLEEYFDEDESEDSEVTIYLGDETHWAYNNPSLPFEGEIDHFMIYKRAMNSEEVQTLYYGETTLLHLPFDEPPGMQISGQGFANVADPSGHSKGTCSGDTCPTSGVSGASNQAASFDGSNDYVDAGGGIDLANQSFTLMAWAKRDSTGRWDMIMGQGTEAQNQGLHFGFRDNNKFTCGFYGNDLDTPAYTDTEWHHWTCTYDANIGYRIVYRDGVRVASGFGLFAHYRGSGNLYIGRALGDAYFRGLIDDVRVYRRALSSYEITVAFLSAPAVALPFDEDAGASYFFKHPDDSGYTGKCDSPHCPVSGVKGQKGTAVEFDGQDDYVELPDWVSESILKDESFTIMAWVKGDRFASHGDHTIMGTDEHSDNKGLHLVVRDGKPYMGFHGNDTTGETELKPDIWYHLTFRYDKEEKEQAIFVNGYLDTAESGHNPFQGTGRVNVGRWGYGNYFDGRIDEVAVYAFTALSNVDIRDIYLYQNKWIEERKTHEITIDTNTPWSSLRNYDEFEDYYRANRDMMLDIEVYDYDSHVALAELGVSKAGQSGTTWLIAPQCLDADGKTAWCATFDPADFGGEGKYALTPRATDVVGHREDPSYSYSFYVDGSPPTVSVDVADSDLLTPKTHPTQHNTWILPLSGEVSDPDLSSGDPGSGVSIVNVTLLDADGNPVGDGLRQVEPDWWGEWSEDYQLYEAAPTSLYTLVIEAEDKVGNRTAQNIVFRMDATPSGAELDLTDVPTTTLTADDVLQGVVSEQPSLSNPLLRLHMEKITDGTTAHDSSGLGNHGVCAGAACPTVEDNGKFGKALHFDGVDDTLILANNLDFAQGNYTIVAWFKTDAATVQTLFKATSGGDPGVLLQLDSDGILHYLHRFPTGASGGAELGSAAYNDNAWHHLAAVRSGNTLLLYVDGVQMGSTSATSAADAALNVILGQNFNGLLDEVQVYRRDLDAWDIRGLAQPQFAGVSQMELAFVPLPGGTSLYEETPPQGQHVHLPLDDTPDQDGNLTFINIAAEGDSAGVDGTCSAGADACPLTGVSGHLGSAVQFDGDDQISLPLSSIDGNFTLAAWIKYNGNPEDTSAVADTFIALGNAPRFAVIRDSNRLTMLNGSAQIQGAPIPLDTWVHAAYTWDGASSRLYIDGQQVAETSFAPNVTGADLSIGQIGGSSWRGGLDDIRLFNRALSDEEIRTLYYGIEPLLILPFDQTHASSGDTWLDASGWDHAISLLGGKGDVNNKAVPGKVGPYALRFDGNGDEVNAGDRINLANQSFSIAFWAKRDPAGGIDLTMIQGPLEDNKGLTLGFYGDGTFMCDFYHDELRTSEAYGDSDWHYWACTYDATDNTRIIYRDGVAVAQDTAAEDYQGTGEFLIGRSFNGSMDDITIYPRAISEVEIQALMQNAWQTVYQSEAAVGDCQTYSNSTPAAIPDDDDYGVDSVIQVNDDFTVGDVNLTLNINHTFVNDLSAYLIAPDGEQVLLFSALPSYGQNFTNTRLDDEADQFIIAGWAPFAGDYRPQTLLSSIDGQSSQGEWRLKVVDPWQGDSGSIQSWELELCSVAPPASLEAWSYTPPTGVEGNYRLDLRGSDAAGLVDNSAGSRNVWSGGVDTLAPRATLEKQMIGNKIRYTTVAQDINLSEKGFNTPCGAGVVTDRQYAQSSQDLTASGQGSDASQRLTQLTAVCELDTAPSLSEIGAYDTPGGAEDVAVSGNYAYVADGWMGLRVIDISNPANPQEVGAFAALDYDSAYGVAVSGNYAYIAFEKGLRIVDISDPTKPQEKGAYDPQLGYWDMFHDVAIAGDYAYVADSGSGLRIIDIANPAAPQQVGVYDTPGQPYGVALSGNYAYVADSLAGLQVIDISTPSNPQPVGAYDTQQYAEGVAVAGDYAYVADYHDGLRIIDISNPADPQEVGAYDTPGYAVDVAVLGSYVYVADRDGGLRIIDVFNPVAPQETESYQSPGIVYGVAASQGYVYVADWYTGLRVVTTADETATACDTSDNCATVGPTIVAGEPGQAATRQMEVDWRTDWWGYEIGVVVKCDGDELERYDPGSMNSLASYYWKGEVGASASCEIEITDTYGDGGSNGTVKIDGSQVASWNPYYGVGTTVPIPIPQPAQPGQPAERYIEVDWTTDYWGYEAGVVILCDGQEQARYDTWTMDGYTAYQWDGAVDGNASCEVQVTDSYGDSGTYGTAKVDGTQVASWSSNYGYGTTVPIPFPQQGQKEVSVAWTTDWWGYEAGVVIACDGEELARYDTWTMDSSASYEWGGFVDNNASCEVQITDSYGDSGTAGTVMVEDTVVASWSSNYGSGTTVYFTVSETPGRYVASVVPMIDSSTQPAPDKSRALPKDAPTRPGTLRALQTSGKSYAVIIEPVRNAALTSRPPLTITGEAISPASLQDLSITADDATLYTQSWSSGTLTSTTWAIPWSPTGDGKHTLAVTAREWGGNVMSDTHTVFFDSSPSLNVTNPAPDTLLRSLQTITLTGGVAAANYLQALTVTVSPGSGSLYTQTWGSESAVNATFATPWTPPGEGEHHFTFTVHDWLAGTATYSTTVIVDTTSPAISIAVPAVLTSTHYAQTGQLGVTGLVTDAGGIASVEWRATDSGQRTAIVEDDPSTGSGQVWTDAWYTDLNNPSDGLSYTLVATATDIAGRATPVSKTILVDVAAPAPVTPTLIYTTTAGTGTVILPGSGSGGGVITPGITIREISPTLVLTWTASSDGSGLADYVVNWTAVTTTGAVTHHVARIANSESRISAYTADKAQKISVRLASQDIYNNQRWQEIGPVYVDSPLTPDYVTFPPTGQAIYRGWMDSGCTLVGADNRIRDKAQKGAALDDGQQLYASWDSQGLRLAWSGADWDTDGDLFIYLDTQTGGSDRAYNPYTATITNTIILLPPTQGVAAQGTLQAQANLSHRAFLKARVAAQAESRLEADWLIWMHDAETVVLLQWSSLYEEWQAVDGEWSYAFDAGADAPITDFYLPFSQLGIGDPGNTSLSLVAFATEDDGLRLWATMPARNSVNSQRVLDAVITTGVQQFPLTHGYTWASLGDGICVNSSQPNTQYATRSIQYVAQSTPQFTGADVRISLTGNPPGIAYSVLGDNLFFAMSSLEQFVGSADWDATLAELCSSNPDAPECERSSEPANHQASAASLPDKELLARNNAIPAPPGHGGAPRMPLAPQNGENDFNAQDGLGALMDVDNPPLGDGQAVTFTLRYVNRGSGLASGLMADVVTWGPMRLPDGTPLSDDQGDYDWLLLSLGDLATGEEMTITFQGRVDLGYDPQNRNGWATIDAIIYDDTGSVYDNQLDWLYVDYEYDGRPPAVGIEALPALIGPVTNTIGGFAFDQSAVPNVTLATASGEWACDDDTPDDGAWSCEWDVTGAVEGDLFDLRARGTDEHGQVGGWTNWRPFTVDATPPTIALDAATEAALSDGLLGVDEITLSGHLADNRLVGAVEALNGPGASEAVVADLLVDAATLPQNIFTYDDVPDDPIILDAKRACYGGGEIYRSFVVTDSFTVVDVDVGLNVDHEFRYDVTAWLVSPSGAWAAVLWDGTSAQNYDVRLNDAALVRNGTDKMDQDTGAPYYENERRPDNPLSVFNGESATGEWQLILCDYFPEEDNGAYNRGRLILTAATLPQNTQASWSYDLPDTIGQDNISRTLTLHGLDSVGNRTTAPLALSFAVDTVAPVITVTTVLTEVMITQEMTETITVLSGTVSDGGQMNRLSVSVQTPGGSFATESAALAEGNWRYDMSTGILGQYTLWVSGIDEAGNAATVGPYQVLVHEPRLAHLPIVMCNQSETH